MNNLSRTERVSFLSLVTLLLVYAYFSLDANKSKHLEHQTLIDQLSDASYQMDNELLKYRGGFTSSYDAISHTANSLQRLAAEISHLSAGANTSGLARGKMGAAQSEERNDELLLELIERRLSIIDDFKSEFSIFRNSVMISQQLIGDLRSQAEITPEASIGLYELDKSLELEFHTRQLIVSRIARDLLQQISNDYNSAKIRSLVTFIERHLVVIDKYGPRVQESINQDLELSRKLNSEISKLQSQIAVSDAKSREISKTLQRILLLLIFILLVFGIYQAKQAHDFSKRLNQQNVNLDRQVKERTSELNRQGELQKQTISRLRKKEAELADRESFYRAITENSVDAIVVINQDGLIESFNPAAEKVFGYKFPEVRKKSVSVIVPPENVDNPDDHIARYLETSVARETGDTRELFGRHKDGSKFPLRLGISVVEIGKGKIFYAAIFRDLTEEKQGLKNREALIQQLSQSKRMMHELVDSLDGMVWEQPATPDSAFTFVSAQSENIFGITPKKLTEEKMGLRDFVDPEDLESVDGAFYRDGEAVKERFQIEYLVSLTADKRIYVRNIVTPVVDENKVVKFRGVIFDVTQYKEMAEEQSALEAQLRQSQKLEAVGQLAAGIAHEINTPSQFVGDNIHYFEDTFEDFNQLFTLYDELIDELGKASLGDPISDQIENLSAYIEQIDLQGLREDIPDAIAQAKDGVSRISSIVKAMKDFSHPGSDNKEYIDLNKAIESTITVARNEWKYVAQMETQFDSDMPSVACFVGELNQTVLNMVVNAAHAIEDRQSEEGDSTLGTIRIQTECDAGFAIIRISDTGSGISEENQRKIFDPFFTTKEVGKGTGQGLYIAHSVIVEKHGGELTVDSTPGHGTEFAIKIPVGEQIGEGNVSKEYKEAS